MNEFSQAHTAARLFGSPPGYIGYRDGNDLATALRANGRTVVLFDEIDKAHPSLWHSLMNLMDAGRLDGQGGDIDARSAILVFTSNKDAALLQRQDQEQQLRSRLRERGLSPEIVGRISRILMFRPLAPNLHAELTVLTVQRIVEAFGLTLTHIEPRAVSALMEEAPLTNGVRDLEHHVERVLAEQLAELVDRADGVRIVGRAPMRVVAA